MSGRRESDPCLNLGKVAYYHYTTPATDECTQHTDSRGKRQGLLTGNENKEILVRLTIIEL